MFKFGKPSISIRAIEKPWRTVSHNQRVHEISPKERTPTQDCSQGYDCPEKMDSHW